MTARLPPGELSLVARARVHGDRAALEGPEGRWTYRDLLHASETVARALLEPEGGDLEEARVAFLLPPGLHYVAVQWGVWRAGGVAVPLAVSHPARELAYVLDDSRPTAVVAHPELEERIFPLARERGIRVLSSGGLLTWEGGTGTTRSAPPDGRVDSERSRGSDGTRSSGAAPPLPGLAAGRRALMLYTSGTTGRPKGVITTHANLEAQVTSLVEAWEWRPDDHILHVLPLHHCHGIVNVLTCALWSGARCRILEEFDPERVWDELGRGDLTLFMAVPTIYSRLIRAWESAQEDRRERLSEGCRKMRLMVSGSAALPVSVLERWEEISGHVLLERYGMTEIGMGLSNPLRGERRPGHVGRPLPGVTLRVVDEDGEEAPPGVPGEIEVRGSGVFLEYWEKPEETAGAFRDGWFRTGDVAVLDEGGYRILGRRSVDIINTGGYKVSALEVEDVLLTHSAVEECAVVGVPDPEWGERVAAALVLRGGGRLEAEELREWAKERLAPYKAPTLALSLDELPRNAMGKVTKPRVRELFEERSG